MTSPTLEFFERAGRRYAHFPELAGLPGLRHAFSTRPDDVSPRSDGRAGERAARRARFAEDLGLPPEGLRYFHQVHRTRVAVVTPDTPAGPLADTDAAVTRHRDVPLMAFSADCPLIVAIDPAAGVLGLAHTSWRCTVADLAARLVAAMVGQGATAGAIHAGIGPSAGPERYEVGEDVRAAAAGLPGGERCFRPHGARWTFDLWGANRAALERAGVPAGQIVVAGVCTLARTDLFYSYRVEGAGCGHFGLLAGLV